MCIVPLYSVIHFDFINSSSSVHIPQSLSIPKVFFEQGLLLFWLTNEVPRHHWLHGTLRVGLDSDDKHGQGEAEDEEAKEEVHGHLRKQRRIIKYHIYRSGL